VTNLSLRNVINVVYERVPLRYVINVVYERVIVCCFTKISFVNVWKTQIEKIEKR